MHGACSTRPSARPRAVRSIAIAVFVLVALGRSVRAQEPAATEESEPQPSAPEADSPPDEADALPTEAELELLDDGPGLGATASVEVGVDAPPARAASDVELDADAYRIVPRRSAETLLTLAPGIVLANHGGLGHASTVYLRGFDAGEGQGFALEVDGVLLNEPSNPHGHGYADPGFVPVELVRRVLVREGPFDPRQPAFSIAGSARYELGTSDRGLRFSLRYGSFRTVRSLLVYAPPGAGERTFVAADAIRGDGFGSQRSHASARALGSYEHRSSRATFRVVAASSATRFDSAGVVPFDAYRRRSLPCATDRDAQFFCTVDPNQGGSSQRHLLLGRVLLDRERFSFEQTAYLMVRDERFRDDFTGIAGDARGDGLDQRYDAFTAAARGAFRFEQRFAGSDQTFELGYLTRHDRIGTTSDRVRFDDGVPYLREHDADVSATEIATYALADLTFGRHLTLQGGLRLEGYATEVTRHGLPTSDRDGPRLADQTIDAFGFALAPRGVVSVHPHPTFDVAISAGIGTRPVDARGLSDGEALPFTRVRALELGLVHRLAFGDVTVASRGALFGTIVDDDLAFDASAGRSIAIGRTSRYGAMLSSSFAWADRLDLTGSFTWSEARQLPPGAPRSSFADGPRVPFVPRFVGRFDAAYHDTLRIRREAIGLSIGLGTTFVGKKPLPYDALSSQTALVDLAAEIRVRFVSLELIAENLFDVRYRSYELHSIADFSPVDGSAPGNAMPTRLFAAGAPRTFFATLTIRFDPSPDASATESTESTESP